METGTVYDGLKRCSRCLLPDIFPGIGFDEDGVGNYCHDQPPFVGLGEDVFTELVARYRGKGDEYDCIATRNILNIVGCLSFDSWSGASSRYAMGLVPLSSP